MELKQAMILRAAERGESMAEENFLVWGGSHKRYKYTVTDNPYKQKQYKKEHVLWHNAFRSKCLELGRRLR